MSSRNSLGCCALAALALLVGCVDPAKRFDEYNERLIDADTNRVDGSGGLFEIDGEFLLAIVPNFAPNNTLRFIITVDIEITGSTGLADLSFQPLKAEQCQPEGNGGTPVGDAIVHEDAEVNDSGAFEMTAENAMVDGQANDVSCGPIRADLTLLGQIRSDDIFCGDITGMVYEPIPTTLEGSTFGAIRVEPGTVGDANLPEPLKACPSSDPVDAGE